MKIVALFLLLALAPHGGGEAERRRVAARDLERLESPDRLKVVIAAWRLGQAGAVEAIPALWKLWRSEDRGCGYAALNALAALGDEQAVGWILDELRSDDPIQRFGAVLRLEAVGRRGLAVHLEAVFGDERLPADGSPCELYLSIGMEARRVCAALTTRSLSWTP